MLSTCPNCLEQIDHEDSAFQVTCTSCDTQFNPFMPSDSHSMSLQINSDIGLSTLTQSENNAPLDEPETSYQESQSLFNEIRDYGEQLLFGGEPQKADAPTTNPPPLKKAPATAPRSAAGSTAVMFSSAPEISGFRIDKSFGLISIIDSLIQDGSAEPLSQALAHLSKQAQARSANAVIAVQWALLPDGERCLISGTAVHCEPNS